MSYDQSTDLLQIQADVLTTDLSENQNIGKLKQLKTETKIVTKAINALNDQLGNAQASASDAFASATEATSTAKSATSAAVNAAASANVASANLNKALPRITALEQSVRELRLLQRDTTYAVNDIAYAGALPSWLHLQCVEGGTTASSAVDLTDVNRAGLTIIDGTVKWKAVDCRGTIVDATEADGVFTFTRGDGSQFTIDVNGFVTGKVAELVDSAPEALNTLKELASALGDDPNFAATMTTELGKKVDKADGKGLSTEDFTTAEKTKLANVAENANNYVLPAATTAARGGVVVGDNITATDGTISVTKDNVTNALGYTPPTTNDNVTNTLDATTKAYITGTTSASTNTGTQVFDSGVYLTTTAGQIHATSIELASGIVLS